jgi:antirestriction protein ArdC
MPHLSQFTDQAAFDATLLHELIHWTAPDVHRKKDDYAFEELVAELGSVFLCESLGIEYKIEHHTSYLESWLKALKDDPKYIVKAAPLTWAEQLKRVFDIDISVCPFCGGTLRVIADVTDPA